jgi:hypothetical protein
MTTSAAAAAPLINGQHESLVYLYNILGWSSFSSIRPVIHPVIHPSKFLIPEEEDDGRGGAPLINGQHKSLVYLYNILGWLSFPSIRPVIRPVIHPSKFLILEEEDDARGGGRRRTNGSSSNLNGLFNGFSSQK